MDPPTEPVSRPDDERLEVRPVEIGAEQQPAAGCAARDVVEAVREIAPTRPGHRTTLAASRRRSQGELRIGTQLLH
jgi:hypothetical protein